MAPKSKRRASNASGKRHSKSSSEVGLVSSKSVVDVETVNNINTPLEPIITAPPPPKGATDSANMSETADSSPTSADSTWSASSKDSTQLIGSDRIENTSSETLDSATSGRQSSGRNARSSDLYQKGSSRQQKRWAPNKNPTIHLLSSLSLHRDDQVRKSKKESKTTRGCQEEVGRISRINTFDCVCGYSASHGRGEKRDCRGYRRPLGTSGWR